MKTPTVSPSGLSFLSLVLLAGCNTESEKKAEEGAPIISVSISATAPLANVQKLSLEFSPSHIYAPCQPGDTNPSAEECWPSNIRVFTNNEGQNRVVEPLGECHEETVHVPQPEYDPEDPDALQRWMEAGGEYQRHQFCTGGAKSENDLALINTLESNPLPVLYIARDNRFLEGTFSRIIVQAWGLPNRDDSYADLIDGRRCEVNVIFPNDIAQTGHHYADFHMPAFTIQNGETWLIDLKLDFGATVIDPARCAEGLDLYVSPGSATAEKISAVGYVWSNRPARLAGFTWSNGARTLG